MKKIKPKTYSVCMDASGFIYVRKTAKKNPCYSIIAKVKCVPTKAKKITRKGIFPGAICVTTKDDILKIVEVINYGGFKRNWIKTGTLESSNT